MQITIKFIYDSLTHLLPNEFYLFPVIFFSIGFLVKIVKHLLSMR